MPAPSLSRGRPTEAIPDSAGSAPGSRQADELEVPVRAGVKGAFDRAMLTYQEELRRFLERRLSRAEDAADASQLTWLRAYRSLRQFEGRSRFRTWLWTIARRTAACFFARDHSSRFVRLEAKGEHSARIEPQAAGDPFGAACARERIRRCLGCLTRSLKVEEQMAVIHCDIYGYTGEETARLLKKRRGAFKHLLHAAREKMDRVAGGACALVRKTGPPWECAGDRCD